MANLSEIHFTHRDGWPRATVLGTNDGIASTASLTVGWPLNALRLLVWRERII